MERAGGHLGLEFAHELVTPAGRSGRGHQYLLDPTLACHLRNVREDTLVVLRQMIFADALAWHPKRRLVYAQQQVEQGKVHRLIPDHYYDLPIPAAEVVPTQPTAREIPGIDPAAVPPALGHIQ